LIEIKFKLNGNGHPKFYELLKEIGDLHDRKNSDYAERGQPLSNFRMSELLGVKPWVGTLVRMSDKWCRVLQLTKKHNVGEQEAVSDESLEDTLKDLAIYALITIILMEEEQNQNSI